MFGIVGRMGTCESISVYLIPLGMYGFNFESYALLIILDYGLICSIILELDEDFGD